MWFFKVKWSKRKFNNLSVIYRISYYYYYFLVWFLNKDFIEVRSRDILKLYYIKKKKEEIWVNNIIV